MSINIKASDLRQSTQDRQELSMQIREIISNVNMKLQLAKDSREMYAVVDLPAVFNVQYMKNSTAQSYVYSQIIQKVQEQGYNARLLIRKDEYMIYITWLTQLEIDEMKKNEEFIRSMTITVEQAKEIEKNGILK